MEFSDDKSRYCVPVHLYINTENQQDCALHSRRALRFAHEVSFLTAISVLHNSRWTLCCVNTSKCQAVGRLFQRHTVSWELLFFYYDVSPFFITAPEKWNLRFKVILVNIKKTKNIKIKRQQHIGFVTPPPAWVYFRRVGRAFGSQSQSATWGECAQGGGEGGGHLNFVIESSWAIKINISECQIAKRTIQCPYKSRSGWT